MNMIVGFIALFAMGWFLIVGLIRPRTAIPWGKSPTRPEALGYAFLCLVALAAASLTDKSLHPSPQPIAAAVDSAQPQSVAQAAAEPATDPRPADEIAVANIIRRARNTYEAADNELKKSNVKIDMLDAMMAAVPRGKAVGWIGEITGMGTNGDGDAWIAVSIDSDITLSTWNNSFSDMGSHTLIKNRSALYNVLADLKKGDTVKFDATLGKLKNLTERGSVDDTDILATFTKIAKIE